MGYSVKVSTPAKAMTDQQWLVGGSRIVPGNPSCFHVSKTTEEEWRHRAGHGHLRM